MHIHPIASGSAGNCYYIDDGETPLLLEAGLPVKEIQRHCGIAKLAGCLITHEHGDHSKAAAKIARYGVDVYASQGTFDALELAGHRYKALRRLEKVQIGSWLIQPFDVRHDAAEPLGFVCESSRSGEKLLYITDTYYVRYTFSGLTHIMAECNYSKDILRENVESGIIPAAMAKRLYVSHMSLEQLLDMLAANDLRAARQIYLLHLSDRNSDEAAFRDAVRRLTGAEVYVC